MSGSEGSVWKPAAEMRQGAGRLPYSPPPLRPSLWPASRGYAAICLEGCVIVLACVIFSAFASTPPAIVDSTLAPATIVWNYVGELVFNMLVLVGAIKMSDRLIRELMGLG